MVMESLRLTRASFHRVGERSSTSIQGPVDGTRSILSMLPCTVNLDATGMINLRDIIHRPVLHMQDKHQGLIQATN